MEAQRVPPRWPEPFLVTQRAPRQGCCHSCCPCHHLLTPLQPRGLAERPSTPCLLGAGLPSAWGICKTERSSLTFLVKTASLFPITFTFFLFLFLFFF